MTIEPKIDAARVRVMLLHLVGGVCSEAKLQDDIDALLRLTKNGEDRDE